jgi:hypothetical protein
MHPRDDVPDQVECRVSKDDSTGIACLSLTCTVLDSRNMWPSMHLQLVSFRTLYTFTVDKCGQFDAPSHPNDARTLTPSMCPPLPAARLLLSTTLSLPAQHSPMSPQLDVWKLQQQRLHDRGYLDMYTSRGGDLIIGSRGHVYPTCSLSWFMLNTSSTISLRSG